MAGMKRKRHILRATVDSDSEEEHDIDVGVTVNVAGERVARRHAHRSPKKPPTSRPRSPTPCIAEPLPAPDFVPGLDKQKRQQVSYIRTTSHSDARANRINRGHQ